MNDANVNKEAFIYITNMIKTGVVALVLGILFMPLVYLLSDRSLTFWLYLSILIFMSYLAATYNAIWRYNQLKKHFKYYSEIGTFWIQKRYEMIIPNNIWQWFRYSLTTCFIFGEWKMMALVNFLYFASIIISLLLHLIYVKPRYEIIFVILLWYVLISIHAFFLFLNWKYKIAKKIKEEYGLDYKDLISID